MTPPTTPPKSPKPVSEQDADKEAAEAKATAPEAASPGDTASTFDANPEANETAETKKKDSDDNTALTAAAPALADTPTIDEAATYGDPSNQKTERVFREGDIDFNSVSDTSHTASGSRYPITPERAESLAASLEAEADLAEHEAEMKRDAAKTARDAADQIRSSVDRKDS